MREKVFFIIYIYSFQCSSFLCKSRFLATVIVFSLRKSKRNFSIDFSSKEFFHLFFVQKYLCFISVLKVVSVGLKS